MQCLHKMRRHTEVLETSLSTERWRRSRASTKTENLPRMEALAKVRMPPCRGSIRNVKISEDSRLGSQWQACSGTFSSVAFLSLLLLSSKKQVHTVLTMKASAAAACLLQKETQLLDWAALLASSLVQRHPTVCFCPNSVATRGSCVGE